MTALAMRRFTVDEYHRMGETGIFREDERLELIEGEIYAMHPSRKRKLTVYEYERLADKGILAEDDRVELIDGEIIQMSPIGKRHASCVSRLTELFVKKADDQWVVWSQNPIRLDDRTEPQPDITLLKRREDFYALSQPTPKDVLLLIEVADSTLAFDRGTKMHIYARAGIPEFWLIDLTQGAIERYSEPEEGHYKNVQTFGRGERIISLQRPTVTFEISEIFG